MQGLGRLRLRPPLPLNAPPCPELPRGSRRWWATAVGGTRVGPQLPRSSWTPRTGLCTGQSIRSGARRDRACSSAHTPSSGHQTRNTTGRNQIRVGFSFAPLSSHPKKTSILEQVFLELRKNCNWSVKQHKEIRWKNLGICHLKPNVSQNILNT